MVKASKALLFGGIMGVVALTAIGCTEEVSSPGAQPASGASDAPAGGSGSAAQEETAPKSGSGSR